MVDTMVILFERARQGTCTLYKYVATFLNKQQLCSKDWISMTFEKLTLLSLSETSDLSENARLDRRGSNSQLCSSCF